MVPNSNGVSCRRVIAEEVRRRVRHGSSFLSDVGASFEFFGWGIKMLAYCRSILAFAARIACANFSASSAEQPVRYAARPSVHSRPPTEI